MNDKIYKICETNFSDVYYEKKGEIENILKVFAPKNEIICCDIQKNSALYKKRLKILKKQFRQEYDILKKLKDIKEVVEVRRYIENNRSIIVEEYCRGVRLKNWKLNLNFDVDNKIFLFLDMFEKIVKIVMKIHEKGVIHNDLTIDNIIVCNNGMIKIIDFNNSLYKNVDSLFYFVNKVINDENKHFFLNNIEKLDVYNLSKILEYLYFDNGYKLLNEGPIKEIFKIIERGVSLEKENFLYSLKDIINDIEKIKYNYY